MENGVSNEGGAERPERELGRRVSERRRGVVRGHRRDGAPGLDCWLQMRVEVAAGLVIAIARGTVLGRSLELGRNASGGAGRIHQQRKNEHERHEIILPQGPG